MKYCHQITYRVKSMIRFAVALLLATSISLRAEPTQAIEEFFDYFPESDYKTAFNHILLAVPDSGEKAELGLLLKSKMENFSTAAGAYYGFDYITETSMGPNLKAYSYIARFEKKPLQVEFVFYKPQDSWRLTKINFNDIKGDHLIAKLRAASDYIEVPSKKKK